ncbi:MAG: hypothetical protein AAGF01_08065 [Cyanobacteria bacterium P01_G01_bin.38]
MKIRHLIGIALFSATLAGGLLSMPSLAQPEDVQTLSFRDYYDDACDPNFPSGCSPS